MQKKFYRTMVKATGIPIPPGAIARWDGGSILDTSGSANVYDGTLNGSPNPTLVNGINGEANGAYSFVSANSQYIDFGDIEEIQNVAKVSISTWLKKTTGNIITVNNSTIVLSKGIFINWTTDDRIYGSVRFNNAPNINYLTTTELGNWTHVAIVYDGTQATPNDRLIMYVNNNSVGIYGGSGDFPALTPFDVGNFINGRLGASTFNNGQTGPQTIYDRALTPAEVAQLFAEKTV